MGDSRDGICNERPRDRNSGRRGVVGSAWWSSFDIRAAGSRNFGDGSKRGVESDRDRVFDFWGVRVPPGPIEPSSLCSCGIVMSMAARERSSFSGAIAAYGLAERAILQLDCVGLG